MTVYLRLQVINLIFVNEIEQLMLRLLTKISCKRGCIIKHSEKKSEAIYIQNGEGYKT